MDYNNQRSSQTNIQTQWAYWWTKSKIAVVGNRFWDSVDVLCVCEKRNEYPDENDPLAWIYVQITNIMT